MAFVNNKGGDEKREDKAASGLPIDFDPNDESIVKVHYDLSAWTIDHRAELSESLADAGLPHFWDGEELVLPEAVEDAADAMFERLEQELGPFPIGLDDDAETTEYGLDEWTDADRTALTEAMVESEIPHRWDGATLLVVADAEESVDDLLDAIESGELHTLGDDTDSEPPDGALSDIFLAADKLAKDPFDAKSRRTLIELSGQVHPKHPPYALAPRVWSQTVAALSAVVERVNADADGDAVDESDESSDVIGLAQQLRSVVRDFV